MHNNILRNFNKRLFILLPLIFFGGNGFAQKADNAGTTIDITGTVMYYTADSANKTLLYKSEKNSAGTWQSGVAVSSFNTLINSKIKTPFLTYDGTTLYFSMFSEDNGSFDIYFSHKSGDSWSEPEKASGVNTNDDESSPTLPADNSIVFFTREQKSKEFCPSIYIAKANEPGSFINAQKAEININCDATPYISPDGKVLFFSSDRLSEKRKKKFALVYSFKIGDVWSATLPIDDIAKEYNEFYPVPDYNSGVLRLVREDNTGMTDAFTARMPKVLKNPEMVTLSGKVSDSDGNPIYAHIRVTDSYSGMLKTLSFSDDKTGDYKVVLPQNMQYNLEFFNDKGLSAFIQPDTKYDSKQNITLVNKIKLFINVFEGNMPANASVRVKFPNGIVVNKEKDGVYSALLNSGAHPNLEYEVSKENFSTVNNTFKFGNKPQYATYYSNAILKVAMRSGEMKIHDAISGKPLTVGITVKSLDFKETPAMPDNNNGTYAFEMRRDSRYSINVSEKGYYYFHDVWGKGNMKQIMNIKLIPLDKINRMEMRFIAFDENSLTPEAVEEMRCVEETLSKNTDHFAFIIVSFNENTKTLAEKRVAILEKYIRDNGLRAKVEKHQRATSKGKPENQPETTADYEIKFEKIK